MSSGCPSHFLSSSMTAAPPPHALSLRALPTRSPPSARHLKPPLYSQWAGPLRPLRQSARSSHGSVSVRRPHWETCPRTSLPPASRRATELARQPAGGADWATAPTGARVAALRGRGAGPHNGCPASHSSSPPSPHGHPGAGGCLQPPKLLVASLPSRAEVLLFGFSDAPCIPPMVFLLCAH